MIGAIAAPMQRTGVSADPAARAGSRQLFASACEPSVCVARNGADAEGGVGRAVAIAAVLPCGERDACRRGRPDIFRGQIVAHGALCAAHAVNAERAVATPAASRHLYLAGLMATHDAAEKLNAFVAKRPTRWEDR